MSSDLREQLQSSLGAAYTLDRELGGGGMSRVFVADDRRLERQVVVKVLSPQLAMALSSERFEREIKLAASLQQANIVPVLSAGDLGGLPYYTMPFVEGESLRARLARGPVSVGETVAILRDVTRALGYAHGRGVVHRDIKPDNILLSGGTAVVTDFGIAKAVAAARVEMVPAATDGPATALTVAGTSIGTPAYMAPEQASGDPTTDHRADLYALGCVAYELCAGRPPFIDRSAHRLLAAHLAETPVEITTLRPDCPPALAELVMRLLAKEPSSRPASAGEVLTILETVSTSGGNAAMPGLLLGGPGMLLRALAIYAAVFIAVALIAKAAIIALGLPDWVFSGAVFVMAIGLPAILATGYVQRVALRTARSTPALTPGGTMRVTQPAGTMASIAVKASPYVTWGRTARTGAYALGAFVVVVGIVIGLGGLGVGPASSLLSRGSIVGSERLLVADPIVPAQDSQLVSILRAAIRNAMEQSDKVTVVSLGEMADALQEMRRRRDEAVTGPLATDIAIRASAKLLLAGEVIRTSRGAYLLNLSLVRPDSSTILATQSATADDEAELLSVAASLTNDLRGKMGESLQRVRGTMPLEKRVTTASMDALRVFSEALRLYEIGEDDAALRLLRSAIAMDSTFAQAHVRLAMALRATGHSRGAVDSALDRAIHFSGDLPEAERRYIEGMYYQDHSTRSDRLKSRDAFEASFAADSQNRYVIRNLAGVYTTLRQFREAATLESLAVVRLPNAVGFGRYAVALMDAGRPRDALRLLDTARAIETGGGATVIARALGTMDVFGIDSAWTALRSARPASDPATVARAELTVALIGFGTGRVRVADRSWKSANQFLFRNDPRRRTRLDLLSTGVRHSMLGDDRAAYAAARSLERVWSSETRPLEADELKVLALLHLRAGDVAGARRILTRFEAQGRPRLRAAGMSSGIRYTRGLIALAERRTEEAILEFRGAMEELDGGPAQCDVCAYYGLARSFELAGRRDSAIVYYTKYIGRPLSWILTVDYEQYHLAEVYQRLAELHDDAGQKEQASAMLRAFVALYANADPELQPAVRAAQRKIDK